MTSPAMVVVSVEQQLCRAEVTCRFSAQQLFDFSVQHSVKKKKKKEEKEKKKKHKNLLC